MGLQWPVTCWNVWRARVPDPGPPSCSTPSLGSPTANIFTQVVKLTAEVVGFCQLEAYMNAYKARYRFAAALLVSLALLPGSLRAQATPAPAAAPAEAVSEFRHLLATHYVTPIDSARLAQATTMEGLLALVRTDPFTDVFSPTQWQQFSVGLGQSFGGIGAVLGRIRDTVVLGDVLPDGPAAAVGLRARDRLVSIDDSVMTGWTVTHAVSRIRGRPGTTVTFGVVRGTAPITSVQVVRAPVQAPSIPAASLTDDGLGVITISQFGPGLSGDLAETIGRMRDHGLKKLIIDLRGNPGGLLDEAISVANLFLPRGSLMVETRYRGQAPERHLGEATSKFPTLPLAVLVGPETASASEIVAGALQDTHRATIVGRQTYGKGLVQSTIPIGQGWMAKLTVGRWFTPAGRLIDRGIHASVDSTKEFDPLAPHSGGIQPDVVAVDSVQDAANNAVKLMGKSGAAFFVALDDEVGAFLTAHSSFAPPIDPIPGSAAHIFRALGATADSLDPSARATLTPWLDAQVTQRAIEARHGAGTDQVWQYGRDPQVRAAATALGARMADARALPRDGTR
jgi:C-terminal peptidase prc